MVGSHEAPLGGFGVGRLVSAKASGRQRPKILARGTLSLGRIWGALRGGCWWGQSEGGAPSLALFEAEAGPAGSCASQADSTEMTPPRGASWLGPRERCGLAGAPRSLGRPLGQVGALLLLL